MPGPKGHVPTPETRRTVEAMAAYGIPAEEVAEVLGVARSTLFKRYARELKLGATKANAKVGETLFAAAQLAVIYETDEAGRRRAKGTDKGGVAAAIFWAKSRMRWTERVAHVGGDKGDEPVKVQHSTGIDLSKLSTEQLLQLEQIALAGALEPPAEGG